MRIRPIFGGVLGFLVSLPQASCREEAVLAGVLSLSDRHQTTRAISLIFNKDIAPIIFEQYSLCHHSGVVTSFSLLSHLDEKKYV